MFILRSVCTDLTDIFFFCTRFSDLVFLPGFGGQSWWIILLWTTYPWIHIRVLSGYVFCGWGAYIYLISIFEGFSTSLFVRGSSFFFPSSISLAFPFRFFFSPCQLKWFFLLLISYPDADFFHYNLFPCHCFMKLRFILDVISTGDWVTARLLQFPWIGSSNRVIQTLSNFKYVYVPLGLGLKGKLYLTGR